MKGRLKQNFIATKEQVFHTRYVKVNVDGKKDLNPECEMCGQNLGSISQIMSRCTKYSMAKTAALDSGQALRKASRKEE